MAFQLFTPTTKRGGRRRVSNPRLSLGRNGRLVLTRALMQNMGATKGARAEVLVDSETSRFGLRVGGPEMNGSSRAISVIKDGCGLFDLKAALLASGYKLPASPIHLEPSFAEGIWVFSIPASLKSKA